VFEGDWESLTFISLEKQFTYVRTRRIEGSKPDEPGARRLQRDSKSQFSFTFFYFKNRGENYISYNDQIKCIQGKR